MRSQKILVTRDIGKEATEILRNSSHEIVVWPEDKAAPRQWVLENARGASGICVMPYDKVDNELLEAAGLSLKVVSTYSVGVDHVDIGVLKRNSVKLGHTPSVLDGAVADVVVTLVLMAMRRGGEAITIVKEGKWPSYSWAPALHCGPSLSAPSLTLGFLGFGRISQAVLTRLKGFTNITPSTPAKVIYTSSGRRPNQDSIDQQLSGSFGMEVRYVDKDELAARSDVLVVLCSLSDSTRGIISSGFLSKMKRTSVLVNGARGGVVDSVALAEALSKGQIFGAGLDVVDGEPNITADHVLVKEPRCVIFPHIASATFEARNDMAKLCEFVLALQGIAGTNGGSIEGALNALAGIEGSTMPAEFV